MKIRKKERSVDKEIKAFLGEDTEFNGKLMFDGVVRIDGKFTGEIFSKGVLVVGETAAIKAKIKVGRIAISGRVNGNIEVEEKVEIFSPGKLYGDIRTPVLIIKEGVIFEGTCKMGSEEKKEKTVVVQKVSEKKEAETGGI